MRQAAVPPRLRRHPHHARNIQVPQQLHHPIPSHSKTPSPCNGTSTRWRGQERCCSTTVPATHCPSQRGLSPKRPPWAWVSQTSSTTRSSMPPGTSSPPTPPLTESAAPCRGPRLGPPDGLGTTTRRETPTEARRGRPHSLPQLRHAPTPAPHLLRQVQGLGKGDVARPRGLPEQPQARPTRRPHPHSAPATPSTYMTLMDDGHYILATTHCHAPTNTWLVHGTDSASLPTTPPPRRTPRPRPPHIH